MEKIRGWHSRGYLPHYDSDRRTQFVTFRLHDSLPRNVLFRLKEESRVNMLRDKDDLELQRLTEKYLDKGAGECYLKQRLVAEIVERKILGRHLSKLILIAWVIMPNHVHLLFSPMTGHSLTTIMQSIKGATAMEANQVLGRTGSFWMRDYFDRYIRDREHCSKAVRYIENNPVKAGLCEKAEDWRFGSAWWKAREKEAN